MPKVGLFLFTLINNSIIKCLKNEQTNHRKGALRADKQGVVVCAKSYARKIIYVQAKGAYNESAKEAWEKICAFAGKKKLYGFKTEFIGISYDDPTVTEPEKLRYEACITVSKNVK
jgi:hypothetical protein